MTESNGYITLSQGYLTSVALGSVWRSGLVAFARLEGSGVEGANGRTLWKLRSGAPWRDLPERYGPWTTCHDRYVRWRRDGTWDRLLAHAQTKSDAIGQIEWTVSVDSSVVRAHHHAAGARHQPAKAEPKGAHAHAE